MNHFRSFIGAFSVLTALFIGSAPIKCYAQPENLKTAYIGLKTLIHIPGTANSESFGKCTPCILERYDKEGHLFTKAVQYTDCGVGFYNEYYPSGKLKITGQHRENDTDKWNDIYDRGFCWTKTGEWIFYSETDKVLSKEYWKDGTFLKEAPERSFNEAWKVDLVLKGNILEKDAQINMLDINDLTVVPAFKNKSNNKVSYCSTLTISTTGKTQISVDFSESGQLGTNIYALLRAKGYTNPSKTYVYILTTNQVDKKRSWGHDLKFK